VHESLLKELAVVRIVGIYPTSREKKRKGGQGLPPRTTVKRIEDTVGRQREEPVGTRSLEIGQESVLGEIQLVDVDGPEQSDSVIPNVSNRKRGVPPKIPLNAQVPLLDVGHAYVGINGVPRHAANAQVYGVGLELDGHL